MERPRRGILAFCGLLPVKVPLVKNVTPIVVVEKEMQFLLRLHAIKAAHTRAYTLDEMLYSFWTKC